jgi:hypothetical protein
MRPVTVQKNLRKVLQHDLLLELSNARRIDVKLAASATGERPPWQPRW